MPKRIFISADHGMAIRWAEAARSVYGSPAGWRNESDLSDLHELRQGFSPPNLEAGHMPIPTEPALDKKEVELAFVST